MFCQRCGTELPEDARFCRSCGFGVARRGGFEDYFGVGIGNNLKNLLCYVFGWLSGLVLLLVDEDKEVRFNAIQSILFFGIVNVIYVVIVFPFPIFFFHPAGALPAFFFSFISQLILGLFTLIMWIVFMVKAFQGEHFKFPIIGAMAEKLSEKKTLASK